MSTFWLTKTPDPETGEELQTVHDELMDAMATFFRAIDNGAEHVELAFSA